MVMFLDFGGFKCRWRPTPGSASEEEFIPDIE